MKVSLKVRPSNPMALVIVRRGLAITAFPVVAPDASVAWEPIPPSRAPGIALTGNRGIR